MEAALRALLVGYEPLTGLVPGERIVWNHLPQAVVRPAIVLYRISGAPGITMGGADGLVNARVQLDVHALGVESMWDIRSAVMAVLHGHRDSTLTGIFALDERQSQEELAGAIIHRSSMDFDVWWAPEPA
jgi:hypothetical protein